MRVTCNKCLAVYEIDNSLIPQQGKKVRCSNCGDIFVCYPEEEIISTAVEEVVEEVAFENIVSDENIESEVTQDVDVVKNANENDEEPLVESTDAIESENIDVSSVEIKDVDNKDEKIEESLLEKDKLEEVIQEVDKKEETAQEEASKDDMQDIFQRLSEQTEELFQQEQNMSKVKLVAIKTKHFLGLQNKIFRRFVLFMLLVVSLLLLYYFRYPITRKFPVMEHVYALANIKSVIPGEGLEFQNITRREFEDDYVNKIEVKGFIANKTERYVRVPKIRLETLDKDARVLHVQYEDAPVRVLDAKGKIAFSIIVTKPSPLSKYVYLTFTDDNKK